MNSQYFNTCKSFSYVLTVGIVNTEKKLFTPEDLKKALKEFRVNKIDDEDTEVRTDRLIYYVNCENQNMF